MVSTAQPHRLRLLVVDDYPANRKLISELLREATHIHVDEASDGEVAGMMCAQQRYSIIFMDIQMPGLDGFATTEHLRNQEPDNRRTPIIALTARPVAEEKVELLKAGMDDFLSKPVSEHALKELLSRWAPYATTARPDYDPAEAAALDPDSEVNMVVDLRQSLALAKGNADIAHDMLSMLIASLPTTLKEMAAAWESGDYSRLHHSVHRLHGGACYCGVPQLLAASKDFDRSLQTKDYSEAKAQYARLRHSGQALLDWSTEHDLDALFF